MTEDTYLTMAEAARYLRLPTANALRIRRRRYGLPLGVKMGRGIVFTRDELDAAIDALRPKLRRIRVR